MWFDAFVVKKYRFICLRGAGGDCLRQRLLILKRIEKSQRVLFRAARWLNIKDLANG